jgi:ABC-type transport system involved in multi-copper enzyme maturation permease subunit
MRAYLAILRDSFREALSSRVLWILIILTSLFLLALIPLGISEQAGSLLIDGDLRRAGELAKKLARAGDLAEQSAGKHLYGQLSSGLRDAIRKETDASGEDFSQTGWRLRNELNSLLKNHDFYNQDKWAGVTLGPEATDLRAKGLNQLDDEQLARFNRLGLQAAYPEHIRKARRKQIQLSYGPWELGLPLPFPRNQLAPVINQIVVGVMVYLLGVGGTLIAILVTAPIIPQTFEPGAVDLLLSKPISRVLLYLTKFFGGCIFVAINISYFIIGVWAILGWRFELWNERLLWCIPVFLFLFAIYYSVSAFAGVLWRSAVMSVVMTIVFWGICWSVGLAKNLVELLALQPQTLVRLTPAGDDLFAVNERGEILLWQTETEDWEPTFTSSSEDEAPLPFGIGSNVIGPVYDPANDQLMAIRGGGRFGAVSGATFHVARRSKSWQRSEGLRAPDGAAGLWIDRDGRAIVAGSEGVFRLEGDPEKATPRPQIFGFRIPVPDAGARFINVGPKLQLGSPVSAALDPVNQSVALFDGRDLVICARSDDGSYRIAAQQPIEDVRSAMLALSGNVLLFAQADGSIRNYDPATLEVRETISPEGSNAPRAAEVSPDGRWMALLFHHRRVWIYDTHTKTAVESLVPHQEDIFAMALASKNEMLVSHHRKRVARYELSDWSESREWTPTLSVAERVYYYALSPLYTVFPKPGQLDQTATYLVTDQETVSASPRREDLKATRPKLDIWNPVWSNGVFVAVMLLVASIYVQRKDF